MTSPGQRRGGKARFYLEGDSWPEELAWDELEPGSLELMGDNLAAAIMTRLKPWLERHGALLERLALESRYLGRETRLDLIAFDWSRHCPNLRRLWLRGFGLGAGVFEPPRLEQLHLQECHLTASAPIALAQTAGAAGSSLQDLTLHQCALSPGLRVGAQAELRSFDMRADEPTAELALDFADCSQLRRLALEFHGPARLTLGGAMSQLAELRLDPGPNGALELDLSALRDCRFDLIRRHYC